MSHASVPPTAPRSFSSRRRSGRPPSVLDFEMRRPSTPRSDIRQLLLALLCLACTGAFSATRGVVRMDVPGGHGWVAATPDEHIVPARTPESLGLLRDGQRVDTRADTRRLGLHGPPHSAPRFLLALHTVAQHVETSRTTARPSSQNRAPYDATAPPSLS
jgi:hypothetical protein